MNFRSNRWKERVILGDGGGRGGGRFDDCVRAGRAGGADVWRTDGEGTAAATGGGGGGVMNNSRGMGRERIKKNMDGISSICM